MAQKLAGVLQKGNANEVLYMLQRISLLERKKKKKADLDKLIATIKHKIELDLKQKNKKGEDDFVELHTLETRFIKFSITEDVKGLLPQAVKMIDEYVTAHNDYVNVKGLEEKAKGKRQKGAAEPKDNLLEARKETDEILRQVWSGLPENSHPVVEHKVLIYLGFKSDEPPRGNQWNQVVAFYDSFQVPKSSNK